MICCCCGARNIGRYAQWWNRDTGYSICARCVKWQAERETLEEILSMYGRSGINYPAPDANTREGKGDGQ